MKPVISPTRHKTLRLRLNLTPTKLARKLAKMKTPVTTKTISNIEKHDGETYPVRENTLKSLSRALEVPPEVLSGEIPLPAKRSPGDTISVQLDARTSLNYELIARRYGVSQEEIINIAPLLFLKAAEESLTRQKRVLEDEVMKLVKSYCVDAGSTPPQSLDMVPVGLLDFLDSSWDSLYAHRLNAIKTNDLFELTVPYDFGGMDEEANPFGDYLQEICDSGLGSQKAGVLRDYMGFYSCFPDSSIPISIVCNDDIERITLGSENARSALMTGAASIKDIPEEYWEPRRAGDRVAWLEDKYEMVQQQLEQGDDIEDAVIVD
jgi:hypothetical protein